MLDPSITEMAARRFFISCYVYIRKQTMSIRSPIELNFFAVMCEIVFAAHSNDKGSHFWSFLKIPKEFGMLLRAHLCILMQGLPFEILKPTVQILFIFFLERLFLMPLKI